MLTDEDLKIIFDDESGFTIELGDARELYIAIMTPMFPRNWSLLISHFPYCEEMDSDDIFSAQTAKENRNILKQLVIPYFNWIIASQDQQKKLL